MNRKPGLVVVWEFRVKPHKRKLFEKMYGPNGDWAKLFQTASGYLRTELIRCKAEPNTYVALDLWSSPRGYEQFKKTQHSGYAALHKRCELLTEAERKLGEFASLETARREVKQRAMHPQVTFHPAGIRIRHATLEDLRAIVALETASSSAAHWSEPTYREIFENKA